jgi:putative heme-binding domain-containing protein
LAQLHALWTLSTLGAVSSAVVDDLVVSEDAGLREHALRVAAAIESRANQRFIPTECLIKLADDPAIRVRLQTALALGNRCRAEPAALAALAKIAAKDADDPWMRLAIMSGLSDSSLAFLPLCEKIPSASGRAQLQFQSASVLGVRRRTDEVSLLLNIIESHAVGDHASTTTGLIDAVTILAGLARGLERSGEPLHRLVSAPPANLRSAIERVAPVWPAAAALAVSKRPIAERLVALDVLSRGRPDLLEPIVPGLLAATEPAEVQSAAARAVARADRTALAVTSLGLWKDLTIATRRELVSGLAGSRSLAEVVIAALEQSSIVPSELDAATRDALLHLRDGPLRKRATVVLARFAPPERSEALARYRGALKLAGDERRGASVFARNCQTCHQRQGQGHRVGPDLSGIAGRAPDALLADVLDPNREVAPDFAAVSLATRRGQVFSGLLFEETATTLKLRRAEGVEEAILRSEIDELRSTGRSLMPEGLEQSITLQEMADLIAFLRH